MCMNSRNARRSSLSSDFFLLPSSSPSCSTCTLLLHSHSLSFPRMCGMSLSPSIALYMHMQSEYLMPSLKLKLQSPILIFPSLPIFLVLSLLHLTLISGVLHVVIWVPTFLIWIKDDPFLPIHVLPTRGHLGRVAPESLCLAARNRG